LAFVEEVSRLAGVHIVVSTGLLGKLPASSARFEEIGIDRSVELFVKDIEQGIGLTGVRAGAFKTAVGTGNHTDLPPDFVLPEGIKPDRALADGLPSGSEFALHVAGRVQQRTGVLVNVHTASRYRTGTMACDVLERCGADLARVAVHHAGETDDLDYLHGMLDRGVTLCMDPHRYAWRLPIIARLVSEGYVAQLVLGVDSVLVEEVPLPDFWFADPRERIEREPEWVPCHVPRAVVPGLRAEGVSETDLRLITVANPARLLSGTAA
jgi:phosphotriesterase-related protein